ncbi:hypothetical protein [Bosea sp. CRIB-10]|uniref:hypothetical protein n=1 Tax=Bosea sp. CRIB-10 TaxID=378404 RepID=UPI001FCDBB36|nr:hypothetical protein [Bosea sp. CRIB-10]
MALSHADRTLPMTAQPARAYRTQNWSLTKPSARGRKGIVVSQNHEAAAAGAAILEAGGNAADAALLPLSHWRRSSPGTAGSAASASASCSRLARAGLRSSISARSRRAVPIRPTTP